MDTHHSNSKSSAGDHSWIVRYRDWLRILAEGELQQRLRVKCSASDIVQQTLLQAWKDREQCRATSECQRRVWLQRILGRQIAQTVRRFRGTQARDIDRECSIQDSLAKSSTRLDQLLPARGPTPSVQAMHREEAVALTEILRRLPADYRQVLVLRHLQELSYREIAEQLGRSEGAVRVLWLRALGRLKAEIH